MTDQPMIREQVEQLKPLLDPFNKAVVACGSGWVGVYSALCMMMDTDAALRAELASMEQSRDEWRASCHQVEHERDLVVVHDRSANQQLAAVQVENERLKMELDAMTKNFLEAS
jgi:hypothetical protein